MNILELPNFKQENKDTESVDLLFGGDFCPIKRYENKILNGEEIFAPELKALFKESFSMVNLETPLCSADLSTDSPAGFGLRSDPEITEYLKKTGIGAVGLANNHARDYGDAGVLQTIQNLEKATIPHAGAGKNLAAAEVPLSITLNGLKIGIWPLAEKELNLASDIRPGSSWFESARNIETIKKIKEQYDFLIIFLHAGHEFITAPSPIIRTACRSFIDAGADAVIAHHPHVIQGVEKYNDSLLAYSLGNLVFDSEYVDAFENTDLGYMVRLNISKHATNAVEIIPYKMREEVIVTPLENDEFTEFLEEFSLRSEIIIDDEKFNQEWENNVKFRWGTVYREVLHDFSKNMYDPKNKEYARRSRNLFACPSHAEMIEKIFLMLEEGKLKR